MDVQSVSTSSESPIVKPDRPKSRQAFEEPTVSKLSRIMYVEDDEDLRAVVSHVLSDIGGYTVEVCADGQEALERAPVFRPQLVLLDVKMPGLSGPEALVHLRQMQGLQKLDAIFMTTLAAAKHQKMYTMLDSLGLLPKPFDLSTLVDDVQALWDARYAD